LFFVAQDRQLMSVSVSGSDRFQATAERPVGLEIPVEVTTVSGGRFYGVGERGERFLINKPSVQSSGESEITVTLNWPLLLKK
jgi:hypothetical protein